MSRLVTSMRQWRTGLRLHASFVLVASVASVASAALLVAPAARGQTTTVVTLAPAAVVPVAPAEHEQVRPVLDKMAMIRVWFGDADRADQAMKVAMGELERVAGKLDANGRGSEVWTVNRAAGAEEVLVSQETHFLLQRSLDLCRITDGAFDITVKSFDYLWDFGRNPPVRPLPDEVRSRLAFAGCKLVALKPDRIVRIMRPGVRISLDDVRGGQALERAAAALRRDGIENFRIRIGGDIYVQGRTGTRHWYAAVPHPRDRERTIAQLYLSSHAAATRSDSDSFFMKEGKRYHDVLDPRTGMPQDKVIQATVISSDAVLADGLSRAVFVLGPTKGIRLLDETDQADGFLVDDKGLIHKSSGVDDFSRLPRRIDLRPSQTARPEETAP